MKKSSFLLLILMYLIVAGVFHYNSHLGLFSENQPIYENKKGFLKFPQIGDLYVIRNQETGYASFFRIAGNPTEDKIYIVSGFSRVSNSIIESSEKLFDLMINNDHYLNKLIIKSKPELDALTNNPINILSIYRQAQRTNVTFSGLYYNTPVGFFSSFLIILLLLWGLSSTFLFSENQFFLLKHPNIIYFSLGITTLFFTFFFLLGKTFLFLWGIVLLFYVFSILPVTYIFQYLNQHTFSKLNFWDREFASIALTSLLGWFLVASLNFIYNFNQRFLNFRKTKKELIFTKQKELQSQAELDALQARVNPHFLYNSLNSIAGLAQEDPAKTEEMAIALSHFFKYSTNRQTENWSTVEKEIEVLETYLEIEKIRFGERLQFTLTCPTDLLASKMPRFLLQPLVENAIKYGYNQPTNSIDIELAITEQNQQLQFQLFDGGMPFPYDMPSGYGLQSIRKKLALLYPDKHELAFINVPKKHVAITLFAS